MIMKTMKIFTSIAIFTLLLSAHSNAEFKTITKKEFLDSNIKLLEKRFDQIDTNKDQKIDAKENNVWVKKVMKARQDRAKAIQKQRAELAKKIDTNKDGKISKEEIEIFKKSQKTKK